MSTEIAHLTLVSVVVVVALVVLGVRRRQGRRDGRGVAKAPPADDRSDARTDSTEGK